VSFDKALALVIALVLVGVVLGAVLFGAPAPPDVAEARADAGAAWVWVWFAARVISLVLVLATLAGLAWAVIRWADRRARSYYADKAGLFPAVRVRQGEAVADLNRAPAGVILGGRGLPTLPDPTEAGLRVTTQAQAAQLMAAATRGAGATPTTARLLEGMNRAPRLWLHLCPRCAFWNRPTWSNCSWRWGKMAAITDMRGNVAQAAERVQAALTQLGFCYETKGGELVQVGYKSLALAETPTFGPVGLLEVDTQRLPRKVVVSDLAADRTTHHLAAVVGTRVGVLNTTGLTYFLLLDPPPRRRLPRRVDLDLENRPSGGPYLVPIGESQSGPVWRTLVQLDAALIGGTRRLGKSTWLNAALAALLTAHGPNDLQVALVDPKEVELRQWGAVPHLVGGVATNAAEAEALLGLVLGEMETRRALFAQVGARNLEAYNRQATGANVGSLPAILLVVDEVADLALEAGGPKADVFKVLTRLVGKGGAFGIHAILATQRPDAEAVAGILKANLPTRLSFWLPSSVDYRLTLAPSPGQSLPTLPRIPGRMLARLSDGYHVLQGYYLDDDQAAAIARRLNGDRPTPAAVLSQAEAELVTWAIEENAGYLSRENLAHGLELSDWKAGQLGADWERRGWLAKDPDASNKRRVTTVLLDLLGRL